MEQEEARKWIKTLIATNTPVHPDRARQLYKDAGYIIPDPLRNIVVSDEVKEQMHQAARKLFQGGW